MLFRSPSGGRVEFKQIGASNSYETADSAYTQLQTVSSKNPNAGASSVAITVRGTDGTELSYMWKGNAYRCSQIKDANGNFININHDDFGLLRTVTDTVGRVNVNYDWENSPISITQNWQANNGQGGVQTHTYATFSYTAVTVNPSFGAGISVYGPQGVAEKP